MGEYVPFVAFIMLVSIVNIILLAWFSAFDIDPETLEDYDPGGFIESIVTFLEDTVFNFAIIGSTIEFFLGWFTDLLSIWAVVPTQLFYIIFLPSLAGFGYAVVKALPTT